MGGIPDAKPAMRMRATLLKSESKIAPLIALLIRSPGTCMSDGWGDIRCAGGQDVPFAPLQRRLPRQALGIPLDSGEWHRQENYRIPERSRWQLQHLDGFSSKSDRRASQRKRQ